MSRPATDVIARLGLLAELMHRRPSDIADADFQRGRIAPTETMGGDVEGVLRDLIDAAEDAELRRKLSGCEPAMRTRRRIGRAGQVRECDRLSGVARTNANANAKTNTNSDISSIPCVSDPNYQILTDPSEFHSEL
jgi:hypothetical protein